MKSPVGIVRIRLLERGRIAWLCEGRNLFVNAGRPALAGAARRRHHRGIRGSSGFWIRTGRTGGD